MKLRDNISHISTNTGESTPFTIKTSAKAFKILSDNLYSDKFTAIIRELSCNAYDSHVEAGKEKTPFEIHLPTAAQPWLSVRDFGVGLSHDDIMNLYTSYFDSDKTGSNKLTGALGLGSKSPFAYTDVFTVESIYEGKKRLYSCFIAKDGTPNITLMSETDTSKGNGVEVKLSVKANDCDTFVDKAMEVLPVFKTKPKVTGTSRDVIPPKHEHYKGRTWRFRQSGAMAQAIQGNVAYPIDTKNFTEFSSTQSFIAHNRFDIDFDIGELDVAASREDLSYDDITIENIKKKLDKVYNSFRKVVMKQLDDCKTLWEAKLLVQKIYNLSSETAYLGGLQYKGKKIDVENFHITKFKGDTTVVTYEADGWNDRISRSTLTEHTYGFSVKVAVEAAFIVNDENRKGIPKARNMASAEKKIVYLIGGDHKPFIKAIGTPPFVKSSALPAPPKSAYDYTGRDYTKIYMPIKYGYSFSSSNARSYDEIPETKKIFYVATKRNFIYKDDHKIQHSTSQEWFSTAEKLNIFPKDTVVYGISTWNVKSKKIATKKQFVEFSSFLEKKVKEAIKSAQAAAVEYNKNVANYEYIMEKKHLYDSILKNPRVLGLDSGSKAFGLKKEYDDIVRIYQVSLNNKHVKTVIELGKKFFGKDTVTDHDDIERIEDVYPMLTLFDSWKIGGHMKEIFDYIKLVDRS